MKKFILILFAAAGSLYVQAQNINPEVDYAGNGVGRGHKKIVQHDSMLSSWCIDVNLMGGGVSNHASTKSLVGGYPNQVNTGVSSLKFHNGGSFGIEAQVGYFFDHKKQFGIGAGMMYMYQQSTATIDKFHAEYQSTDVFGNVFRQEVTANHQIKETFKVSSFNFPIVFKYKTRISGNVGFTADAGLLINVVEQNKYKTNASFDYEAVYQYVGTEGGISTVYDNAPTPATNDLVITKDRYVGSHSNSNIQDYFTSLKEQGYNVGLGVKPKSSTGKVSMGGSVGLMLRPAISLYLSDMIALNFGAYFIYQTFNHNAQSNYKMTDKTGDYSSVLNTVKTMTNNSYGVSAGVRIFLPEKHREPEIVIPDLPVEPVAENDERPENDEVDEVEPAHIDISTPILFDIDKSVIKHSGYSVLEEAVRQLNADPSAYLVIHGYADITGTPAHNKSLSKRRANAVKNYLVRKGLKSRNMSTIGHGTKYPAATNKTRAGRAQNRRVIIRLNEKE